LEVEVFEDANCGATVLASLLVLSGGSRAIWLVDDVGILALASGKYMACEASVQVLLHGVVLSIGLPSDVDLVVDWHGAVGGLAAAEHHSRVLSACQIASHIVSWLPYVLGPDDALGHWVDQIHHINLSLVRHLAQVRLLTLIKVTQINDGHGGSSTLHHGC
jgi:hypothetical protein